MVLVAQSRVVGVVEAESRVAVVGQIRYHQLNKCDKEQRRMKNNHCF